MLPRISASVSAAQEDAQLFPGALQRIVVGLAPEVQLSPAGDIFIMGRVGNTPDVPVIISGRRTRLFGPLHSHLSRHALRAPRRADGTFRTLVPTVIEGVWHAHFERDEEGWESRQNQLVAARWAIFRNGEPLGFHGELPVQDAVSPVFGAAGRVQAGPRNVAQLPKR